MIFIQLNCLPVLVWVHLLGGHDLQVDLLVEVVGVEEGVAGGADGLREGGPVVAVADVAHRAVGRQERGRHLRDRSPGGPRGGGGRAAAAEATGTDRGHEGGGGLLYVYSSSSTKIVHLCFSLFWVRIIRA